MMPHLITGADANYFAMTCLLAQSLEPGLALKVCDFGLNEAQRRFLRGRGMLLERPETVPEGCHPYLAKAALPDYLTGLDGPVAWLDCDMLAVAPFAAELTALATKMAAADIGVAACPDAEAGTLAAFIARWQVPPFAAAVARHGLDGGRPYFNSGFFVCRDRPLLHVAAEACREMGPHRMVDQNAFNLAALSGRGAALNAAHWNAHGPLLGRLAVGDTVTCDGRQAYLLHATSVGGAFHEERKGLLRGPTGALPFTLKLIRHPAIAARQQRLLAEFFAERRAALGECGCLSPSS